MCGAKSLRALAQSASSYAHTMADSSFAAFGGLAWIGGIAQ